jgi:hypothetical protein
VASPLVPPTRIVVVLVIVVIAGEKAWAVVVE